jgi:hypothetical protein
MDFRGKWVWVTGASSGLGKEMARQLAFERGANLVLTARRAGLLEALKADLEANAKVSVKVLAGDMAISDDVQRLFEEASKLELSAVVLNAGVTHFGRHSDFEWKDFERLIQINVVSTARLTSELVRDFEKKNVEARVMLVTSMAGIFPVPYQSAYSGSKAFLTAFGSALAHELKGTRVSVTVFAPGGIVTEMTAGEKFQPLAGWLAPAEDVAREAISALELGPVLRAGGFINKLGTFVFRFLPRNLVLSQVGAPYRKALAQHAAKTAKSP